LKEKVNQRHLGIGKMLIPELIQHFEKLHQFQRQNGTKEKWPHWNVAGVHMINYTIGLGVTARHMFRQIG